MQPRDFSVRRRARASACLDCAASPDSAGARAAELPYRTEARLPQDSYVTTASLFPSVELLDKEYKPENKPKPIKPKWEREKEPKESEPVHLFREYSPNCDAGSIGFVHVRTGFIYGQEVHGNLRTHEWSVFQFRNLPSYRRGRAHITVRVFQGYEYPPYARGPAWAGQFFAYRPGVAGGPCHDGLARSDASTWAQTDSAQLEFPEDRFVSFTLEIGRGRVDGAIVRVVQPQLHEPLHRAFHLSVGFSVWVEELE